MSEDRRQGCFVRRLPCLLLLSAALLVSAACAKKKPIRTPVTPSLGSVEQGAASWYGYPYHGRRTASGEVYDMEQLTAAHRTLPFGVWVEVLNLSNDRTVQVRINDRGPFVDGRIVDLSRAAAREIEMIGPGIAQVRLVVIAPPAAVPEAELYAVQVGAFLNRDNAERLSMSLRLRYPECSVVQRDSSSPPWRVLVGREPSPEAAAVLAGELRREFRAAFVVRLDQGVPGGL